MSASDLSPEQDAAVRAPLGDVCVTAGAGSGKTRVLTARFVEHARTHGIPVRRIAALTFTDKAARQMRARIAAALGEETGARAGDEVALAPILTLHAFCARLLRRNAVAAGVDPAFRVLDDTEMFLLREEALGRASALLEARPDADALWAALQRLPGTDPLRAALHLFQRLRGAGADPAALTWHAGPVPRAQAEASVRAALADVEREAAALPTRPDAGPFVALVGAALSGDGAALALVLGEKKVFQPGTSKPFKALRDARDAVRAALEVWEGALLDEQGAAQVPALRALLGLLGSIQEALKRERSALDYDDLEQQTDRLLARLQARGERPEGLPQALLVDEHQDTNPVQEGILARLRALGLPQFSVGDPKQSIYRFRRADVGVLLAERERVGAAGRRALAESYRAAPEVVAALDGLFARLFEGGRAGVPFEPLVARGEFAPPPPGSPPAVQWTLLDRGPSDTEAGRRREAVYVAAWLKDLVERRTPRRKRGEAPPGEAGPERFLTYRDCAILVPVRTMFEPLERALTAAGVPYRVHKGRGYLASEEVRSLVHALRVLHDPLDEHALACLVRGPALAADDARLLTWFGGRDGPRGLLPAWERLRADGDPAVAALVAEVEALRRLAVGGTLPEVVAAAVERLGLLHAALAQPDGRRRAANLRRAVSVAQDVARAGHHGLPEFLAYLEDLEALDLEQAEAPALAVDGDEVSLMTVHAAKGLEWPVVVLADAGRKPREQGEAAYVSAGGGVAFRLRDGLEGSERAPQGYVLLKQRDDEAGRQEALRLLYVAATRAEERLLVTATFEGITGKGLPSGAGGWARTLAEALGPPLEHGVSDLAVGAGEVRVEVVPAPEEPGQPAAALEDGAVDRAAAVPCEAEAEAEAARRLQEAERDLAPLAGTRFVVGVSELLTFARSPAEAYAARLEAPATAAPPDLAVEQEAQAEPPLDASGSARGELAREPDEPEAPGSGIDRAALGSAVHAALERWPALPPAEIGPLLGEAFGGQAPPAARAAFEDLIRRFAASPLSAEVAEALAQGADVRREVAFHARIRFPGGARVGPFEALLVKGSIDLWLPREGGLWLVDYKTNAPSTAFPTPERLADHYAWQLRLYALAAERLLGRDVAGASLLLLDPGWGPAALEVPVDVSGAALEEARRLAQAFATAELEGRWPDDWRLLLPG